MLVIQKQLPWKIDLTPTVFLWPPQVHCDTCLPHSKLITEQSKWINIYRGSFLAPHWLSSKRNHPGSITTLWSGKSRKKHLGTPPPPPPPPHTHVKTMVYTEGWLKLILISPKSVLGTQIDLGGSSISELSCIYITMTAKFVFQVSDRSEDKYNRWPLFVFACAK